MKKLMILAALVASTGCTLLTKVAADDKPTPITDKEERRLLLEAIAKAKSDWANADKDAQAIQKQINDSQLGKDLKAANDKKEASGKDLDAKIQKALEEHHAKGCQLQEDLAFVNCPVAPPAPPSVKH
jgi:hypothetical protein